MKREAQATKSETKTSLVPDEGSGIVFTGERYVPTEQGEIRLEHVHRYAVALDIVAGKDVLDIASGEGYGAFLLAMAARTVIGIDISEEAVLHARAVYRSRNNLIFKQGNAIDIALPDQSFDIVVSFETIEHLTEQSKMLSEIRRVLKPTGILLISSPNRPVYSDASGNHNKFHVKELDFNELDFLLREQFNAIRYFGQRLVIGSIIQPLAGAANSLRALRDDGANVQQTTGELSNPVYFLALCAATQAVIPSIDASVMQPDKLDLLKQYVDYANWAIRSNKELEMLRKLHGDLNEEHHNVATWAQSLDRQVSTFTHVLSEREQQIAALSDDNVRRGEWALGLEAQLKTAHNELASTVTERENHADRIALLDKELEGWKGRYARLEQERYELGIQAQSIKEQFSGVTELLTEREKEVTRLLNEIVKQRESALGLVVAHGEREWALYERMISVQAELRNVDQQWREKCAEHVQVLTRESALQDRLLSAQAEWTEISQERAEKAALQQQLNATLRAQIQGQIEAAKQFASQCELAQNTLRRELDAIKSSLTWRLTGPLRKLGLWWAPPTADSMPYANPHSLKPSAPEIAMSADRSPQTVLLAKPPSTLGDLLNLHDEPFLHAAYYAVLLRGPDAEGLAYYLNRLRSGIGKLEILSQLRNSKEGQAHKAILGGLDEATQQFKRSKQSILRAIFARGRGIETQRLNALENHLYRLNGETGKRFDQLEKILAGLPESMAQQTQTTAAATAIREFGYEAIDSWRVAETLVRLDGMDFLDRLFSVTLGRPTKAHESAHYLHLLGMNVSKLHIIDLLFSSDECKRRLAKGPAVTPVTTELVSTTAVTHGATGPIRFFQCDAPLVSVVIPVYGKVNYTLSCLRSIQNNAPTIPFEIVVVDDKSPDNTLAELSKIDGIKVIANAENLGFIRSCNSGAQSARGNYVCFLNNDTEVTMGWLDELVRTFREFPGTGFAGSKLIYPDGSLQEAGGIIWQDGSAWNFGRNQDPLLPVYNYAREVDYCSGASIMVPKILFEELGGFDHHYLPAYCEDSDLALKVRSRGLRVIYQPLSVVVHYEGITSGTDTGQGVKAHQLENSKKLFERWKTHLQHHQANGVDVDDAKDRMATRRVLVLDHCTPTPNQDAGSVTVVNTLLLLREMNFQITFIPEDNFLYLPEYTTSLQRIGIEILYAPFITSVEQHVRVMGNRYDLVLIFRPAAVERHLHMVRAHCLKAKVLYHTVDLHYLRMMREAALFKDATMEIAALQMKQREFSAIRSVDASIVHSTTELDLIRPELNTESIYVFPLILDVPGTSSTFSDRMDIVFVGGYQHAPNVDSVQYFVAEIMPLLRRQLPGVRFHAVGSNPPHEIQALASEDVIIAGFVEDLLPFLDKMRVSVAPLRYGAGIKGKIGTAMAAGLPVVATSLASEGMALSEDENILIADDAEEFTDAIVKLYRDESLWKRMSQNGVKFATNTWGAEAAWKHLARIIGEMGLNSVRHARQLSVYTASIYDSRVVQSIQPSSSTIVAPAEYQKRIQQEFKIYEKQIMIHDLPQIYHYWSNKYLVPILHEAGIKSIQDFFLSNLVEARNRTGSKIAIFVSIGAGNCDLEASLAKNLIEDGFSDFILECLEINPVMLERGREIAKRSGVLANMKFVEADFNTWVSKKKYDGVIANQSLHHVSNLEHLFEQIKKSLHVRGSFLISDMIGRNGHQRWPESLQSVNHFWREVPNSHKFNVALNRFEEEYINWDCSKEGFEGIRAQDILALLLNQFQCEKFVGFGSAIDIFIDRCFGHNFNPESEWDRDFIDRVHAADESGLTSRNLTPTHMLGIFVNEFMGEPYYSRNISPFTSIRRPS